MSTKTCFKCCSNFTDPDAMCWPFFNSCWYPMMPFILFIQQFYCELRPPVFNSFLVYNHFTPFRQFDPVIICVSFTICFASCTLEGKYKDCFVLHCVYIWQLCTMMCTHKQALLNLHVGLSLDFVLCVRTNFPFHLFFCISLEYTHTHTHTTVLLLFWNMSGTTIMMTHWRELEQQGQSWRIAHSTLSFLIPEWWHTATFLCWLFLGKLLPKW